ncbi:MAG: Ig-like domain-containing protein [FCB group bacterium]|nr:Ig-like domain-containing protein [FCB group bacterium]
MKPDFLQNSVYFTSNRFWITGLSGGLMAVLLWTCAAVQSPPGGPKDITPPELIEAVPPNESVNITDTHFQFRFSEFIQEASLSNGIQIFPRPTTAPLIDYKDDAIELNLLDTLRPNQTYIITLTRSITDEHQVALAQDIQYAFSTGSAIDRGMITGRVTNSKEASVHLWKISTATDSLFFSFPDYVARCGEDGTFRFSYLSPGSYRLLAVDKSGTGVPLNPRMTAYGIPGILNIPVRADTVGRFMIRLHKEALPLSAVKGVQYPAGWAEITFNTVPDPMPRIVAPDGTLLSAIPDPRDSLRLVLLGAELSDSVRIISPDGAEILLGLTRISEPDTTSVTLLSPSGTVNIRPERNAQPELELIFSKPLLPVPSPALLPLVYSRNDSTLFESLVKQESPFSITIQPFRDWEPNSAYYLTAPGAGFVAFDSTTFQDSILMISVSTGRAVGYGSLSGSVEGTSQGVVGITLTDVENPGNSFQKVVNLPSSFEMINLPESAYLLSIFSDRDSSGTYTYGRAYPPDPGEYFWDQPDTITIRAHWETVIPPIRLQEY